MKEQKTSDKEKMWAIYIIHHILVNTLLLFYENTREEYGKHKIYNGIGEIDMHDDIVVKEVKGNEIKK